MRTFNDVVTWYRNWLDKQKLPQESADEVVYSYFNDLTSVQTQILFDFILFWDNIVVKHDSVSVEENFKNWIKENNVDENDLTQQQTKIIKAYKNITFLMDTQADNLINV